MELLEHHTEGWDGDRDTQVKRMPGILLGKLGNVYTQPSRATDGQLAESSVV